MDVTRGRAQGVPVGDAIASALASLTTLEALSLSRTACGDATVAALTYGLRLCRWRARRRSPSSPVRCQAGSVQQGGFSPARRV